MSKRLLVIIAEMEVGGSQRTISYLLTNIDRTQYEPELLYFRQPSYLLDELRAAGVTVHHIAKHRRLDVMFFKRLLQFLRRRRYDVIHCFPFTAELWGALAFALCRHGRLYSSVYGKYEWYSPWQWRAKRFVTALSSAVISDSRAGAAYAVDKMRAGAGKMRIIDSGVVAAPALTPPQREALRQSLAVPADTPVVLFVGRLVEDKNVPCLLRALHRLVQRQVNLRALLAGDGPLLEDIRKQINAAMLHNVVSLLGERRDVPQLMQLADIVVSPSFREGLSNTIIEAMIAGTAVVASAVGGSVELIRHRENGWLFESDDDVALADGLQQLLSDHELRVTLGQRAQRDAEQRFSVSLMTRKFTRVYEEAAGND